MVTLMDSICNTIGIDRVDMHGRMVLIEEQHGSDANFLVNALISNALKKDYGICFVLFHNTFSHYHNVSMRSGHNLMTLKEKGKVTLVEPMKELMNNINGIYMDTDTIDVSNRIFFDLNMKVSDNSKDNRLNGMTVVDNMFKLLRDSYNEVANQNKTVLIIIEDISHLSDLGLTLKDSMYYVRYIRSLMESYPMTQLCVTVHTYQNDVQSCTPNFICNNLKYMADLVLIAEPLMTGHSNDASGKITVCWNVDSVRSEYHWTEKMTYLYKLLGWHVKIFALGATTFVT
ncbi:elongator complex protein 6-like [Vespa velutina]|uniref:elongator complex protein 6-like n=1 Tax=Vespa velutina TaxID=202808 RepID=UPI001FB1ED06|nr:elongator complex protein 6-like [Vespa velutina]XP_047359650.1 elongator complex protein 6-like [Vespa velutina]